MMGCGLSTPAPALSKKARGPPVGVMSHYKEADLGRGKKELSNSPGCPELGAEGCDLTDPGP